MRIYLANIGANSSHSRRLNSPLLQDGKFELLPIPEGDGNLGKRANVVCYRDLRSHYDPEQNLLRYVHQDLRDAACHNDPDFQTFTYGDNGTNGRSSALTYLRKDDVLLFLARLERFRGGRKTGDCGFYLIGGLRVDYAAFITPVSPHIDRFANNAHVIRGDSHFLGVAGTSDSRRFERAIPIVREICEQVFRDKDGHPWTWGGDKSDLSRIGSYTRACRCVLDTAHPEQAQRAATLRQWIVEYSSMADADLLSES